MNSAPNCLSSVLLLSNEPFAEAVDVEWNLPFHCGLRIAAAMSLLTFASSRLCVAASASKPAPSAASLRNRPAQCEARRRSTFVPSGPTALFQFFPDYGKRAARLCNTWRTKTDKILAVYSFRLESAEESVDLKISAIGPNCVPTAQP